MPTERRLKPGEEAPAPYFEGRVAPLTKSHPHRMRRIAENDAKWITGCADCGRIEVIKKEAL